MAKILASATRGPLLCFGFLPSPTYFYHSAHAFVPNIITHQPISQDSAGYDAIVSSPTFLSSEIVNKTGSMN